MINRTNNISFKRAIGLPSIYNMKPENMAKLDTTINVCNSFFPNNDVIFGADSNGELVYEVIKTFTLLNLMHPKVLENIKNIKIEDLSNLVLMAAAMKDAHNKLWNLKEPFLRQKTDNIDNMDDLEIAYEVRDAVMDFNDLHPEDEN